MTLIAIDDERRVAEAISNAERKTSGEIVAIVTAESASYLYAPVLWAALASLALPWPLIYWTWWPVQTIYLLQVLVFLILALVLAWRPLRYWLVPRRIKELRAHRRAVEQFLTQSLHSTAGRTGVLLYVSVAERYVEVLADTGIHQRVPKADWQGIVDRLTNDIARGRAGDGFVAAVEAIGERLAEHFPPGSRDPNELPNHLIVLPPG
jgi:putative membrane protein